MSNANCSRRSKAAEFLMRCVMYPIRVSVSSGMDSVE